MSLPRDAKGRFLPRGGKNTRKTSKNRKTKRKRKAKTPHGSHKTATSVLQLLDPVKDVIDLLSPLLGGSHTPHHKKQQAAFKKLITTGKTTNLSRGPMKRRRLNQGGRTTKDVFPNFMTGHVTQSTDGEFVTVLVNTPIPRLQARGNKATVMELLWVEWSSTTMVFDAGAQLATWQFVIGQAPAAILDFDDPRVIAMHVDRWMSEGTPASGLTSHEFTFPVIYNFQDNGGHGYLLASDSFHASVFSSGQAVPAPPAFTIHWRLYYRFIEIPLAEFVGIVQSTTSN